MSASWTALVYEDVYKSVEKMVRAMINEVDRRLKEEKDDD